MRILLALVALCRWRDLLAKELTTVTTQRSNTVKEKLKVADKRLDFVNIIRDDLQRNNDDYALLEQQNQLVYPAPPVRPPNPAPPVPRPPYRKRMLPPEPRPQPPRQYYGNMRRKEGDIKQSFHDDNAFRSYTRSKNYKIERVNKLKQLLNKDKIRMRDSEQNEEDTRIKTLPKTRPSSASPTTIPPKSPPPPPSVPPPPSPPPPPPPPPPPSLAPASSPPLRTPEPLSHFTPQPHDSPPLEDTEQEVPVLRQRKEKSQSPSPDQLDMAAARNPEITHIRLKGRLCQRNLMNMEGPTYDKVGKTVIPEFTPRSKHGRQFHQTRKPALVLPRCCNCCKKSVLGCQ